jgi:hypothetical protein
MYNIIIMASLTGETTMQERYDQTKQQMQSQMDKTYTSYQIQVPSLKKRLEFVSIDPQATTDNAIYYWILALTIAPVVLFILSINNMLINRAALSVYLAIYFALLCLWYLSYSVRRYKEYVNKNK